MKGANKLSEQIAKVRAKLSALEDIKEEYDNAANDLAQAYSTDNWA